jgi:hypothetical protein
MTTPIIIGLGHYSRTGKDTFANYLLQSLSWLAPDIKARKIPFAWKLKEIAHGLFGWAGVREPEFYDTPEGAAYRDIEIPELEMTPVQLWVALGTPAVRENVYDRTWIDYVLKTDHGVDVLIVPDVRFPNETIAIHEAGGTLVKIIRPGVGPRRTVADWALVGYQGWDNVIGETGSLAGLEHWAGIYAQWVVRRVAGEDLPLITRPPEEIAAALRTEVIEPWEVAA